MKYCIRRAGNRSYVCCCNGNGKRKALIVIDESLISAKEFIRIIRKNKVESVHMQNIYDDITSELRL